jgi:hypothetical protein
MKMREVAFIFGPLYSAVKFWAFILTKYGLGYILGEFLTNSSDHPAWATFWAIFLSNSSGRPARNACNNNLK